MENKELKERFIDERTGIEYTLQGDYYIHNITIPRARRTGNIGKYGRLKLNCMKKYKIPEYTEMLLSNELKSYLLNIEDEYKEKMDILIKQMAEKENINEDFEDFEKFATLSQKLSWSHFVEIVKMDTDIKRKFYATMCMNENWSVRTLKERVDSALFERTAISKKPEQTIINDLQLLTDENKMTTDLFFRDPYILDFLELKDTYSEKDLENAIINELEKIALIEWSPQDPRKIFKIKK